MKSVYFSLAILILMSMLACQEESKKDYSAVSTQADAPQIFKEKKKKTLEEKARTVAGRLEYELQLLRDPLTQRIPENIRQLELKAAKKAPIVGGRNGRAKNDPSIVVEARGPNNFGGRTRAIAFDQRNTNIILAGGVSSGVFRTSNGGTSWTKVSPNDEIHSVTTIVQDPTTPDIWYYGTGELQTSTSESGAFYLGQGIWKSVDNGVTWNVLASTQFGSAVVYDNGFDFVHRLAVHPITGDVYAAASNAILRSTDDGANWAAVLGTPTGALPAEITITPSGRLYAAFHGGNANEGVWTSATGNVGSWTRIAGGGVAGTPAGWNAAGNYGRIVLNHAPSSDNIVYALYYNNITSNCAGIATPEADLFRWNNTSSSWTDLSANMPDEAGCANNRDPFAVQGGYDLCVAVKPDNPNVVFVGGTSVYRSTNGFSSMAATTLIGGYGALTAASWIYPNHHPDIHALVFAPGDNNTLYTGSDGGVHRANINPATVNWTSLNNDYITYQYYHVDLSPASGNDGIMGGAQDNGTTTSATGLPHSEVFSGDGASVGLISYANAANFNAFVSTQFGTFFRLIVPFGGWNVRPAGTNSSIFVTYSHLDQDNTNYIYYVDGTDLYRSRIGNTISASTVTGNSATGWELLTGVNQGSNIRAMATSRNNAFGSAYLASNASRKLLIGLEDGRILRLNNPAFSAAATVPSDISPATATGTVIGLSINPENDNEGLAVYSNYNVNSVYLTFRLKQN